ncbi:MAG: FHA domain-containing protein, partial [Methanospirillum sp.]|uniref:FHA domain-containing protein n=1 Tax=Methanospirillum sp. TaxID=45200 RepID=UPI002370871C
MTLQKICDVCGMANPATEMICQRCFSDLSRNRPVDSRAVRKTEPAVPQRRSSLRIMEKPQFDQDKTIREVAPLQLVMGPNLIITVHNGDTIGRDAIGSRILNQHSAVSRHHATFKYMNGKWLVRDEDSTNGTYINGKKLGESK